MTAFMPSCTTRKPVVIKLKFPLAILEKMVYNNPVIAGVMEW